MFDARLSHAPNEFPPFGVREADIGRDLGQDARRSAVNGRDVQFSETGNAISTSKPG